MPLAPEELIRLLEIWPATDDAQDGLSAGYAGELMQQAAVALRSGWRRDMVSREAVIGVIEAELVPIYEDTPNETDATCNAIIRHIAEAVRKLPDAPEIEG